MYHNIYAQLKIWKWHKNRKSLKFSQPEDSTIWKCFLLAFFHYCNSFDLAEIGSVSAFAKQMQFCPLGRYRINLLPLLITGGQIGDDNTHPRFFPPLGENNSIFNAKIFNSLILAIY